MAGVVLSQPRRAPRDQAAKQRQSGQVLLDALIATTLLSLSLPVLAGTARMVASQAQARHRELLVAIEAENACAFAEETARSN